MTLIAVGLLALSAVAMAAPQPVRKALDCNSAIDIAVPLTIMPGEMFDVTLTVTNGDSSDAGDLPVAQTFATVTFYPSCTSTMPCVPDAALPVSYVPGSVGPGTCPVMTVEESDVMMDGTQWDFTFDMGAGLTVPAAAMADGSTSCDLTLQVMVDSMFEGSIGMQANTAGVCDVTGLDSAAEATASLTIMAVPTLGEMGLLLLALLLGIAAWRALRRQTAAGAA